MQKRLSGILLIALVLVTLVVYLVHPDDAVLQVVGNVAQTLAGLLSAIFLYRAARAFTREDSVRPYWLWLSAGYLLNALGFALYAWYEIILGLEVPTPSWADLLWILAYPAMLYGSFALLRQYANSGLAIRVNKLSWAVVGVVFALAGYFLMLPIITSDAALVEKLTLLAYPVLDVVLFGASVTIALMMRQFGAGKLGAPWTFIALGMIAVSVSDMVYTYLTAQELYQTGNLVDLGWVLQGALVAWGGILQYHLIKGDRPAERVA